MSRIPLEPPPPGVPPDLADYLMRLAANINSGLANVQTFTPRFVLPDKPQTGQVVYFGQALLPDVTAPGWWGYNGTTWEQLNA